MDAAQTPEHLKQEETADWLRAHARDMSFAGLCDDLKLGQAILPLSAGKGRRAFSFSFADTPEKRDYALRYNRGNQPLTLEANFVFEWLRGGATVSTSFADVRSVRAAAFLV